MNRKEIDKLGGLHSAKIILYSVEFAEIENYQSSNHKINEKSRKIFQKIIEKNAEKGCRRCYSGMHRDRFTDSSVRCLCPGI